jgi:hypothetical protein
LINPVITRYLKTVFIISLVVFLAVTSTACLGKKAGPVFKKALVEMDGSLNTIRKTNRGWIIASGRVANRGDKRAGWVRVTVYTKDVKTGVVLRKKTTYVKGSGPNGKSLEPGESASFYLRLDSKPNHRHEYEAEVLWSDAL